LSVAAEHCFWLLTHSSSAAAVQVLQLAAMDFKLYALLQWRVMTSLIYTPAGCPDMEAGSPMPYYITHDN
jgi:hypothetical protein